MGEEEGASLLSIRQILITCRKDRNPNFQAALRAKEAPEHIKVNWPGSAWIVEVITSTTTCKGKRDIACHRFITSLRTIPDAQLRLIRQR